MKTILEIFFSLFSRGAGGGGGELLGGGELFGKFEY